MNGHRSGSGNSLCEIFGLDLQEALNADGVKRLLATVNLEKAFATDFTDDTA